MVIAASGNRHHSQDSQKVPLLKQHQLRTSAIVCLWPHSLPPIGIEQQFSERQKDRIGRTVRSREGVFDRSRSPTNFIIDSIRKDEEGRRRRRRVARSFLWEEDWGDLGGTLLSPSASDGGLDVEKKKRRRLRNETGKSLSSYPR